MVRGGAEKIQARPRTAAMLWRKQEWTEQEGRLGVTVPHGGQKN